MNVKPDFSKNANQATTAPAFLSVWDMHAYYGESYIVQGINFNVHEGEILALLGRNGAGKTSTLRSIARTGSPMVTQGEIWLDHQPLHLMESHEAAAAGLGLVPEDRRIIPGLTVEENLQLAQIAPPIGWSIDRLYDLFPRLGERRKQEGVTLSGGEQQMLAIARALARDIKVLLLDEPYEGPCPGDRGRDRKDPHPHQGTGHDHHSGRTERGARAGTGRPGGDPRHGRHRL